jgi:hypothetical protein
VSGDEYPDLRTGHKPNPVALTKRCPVKTDAHTCYLIEHPGIPVHVDLSAGWIEVWSPPPVDDWANVPTVPSDPLQDAPEALRD